MTTAGEVVVTVEGKDIGLSALLTRLEAQMRQVDQTGVELTQTVVGSLTPGQARAAAEARKLSVSQAQVALTGQRMATEEQRTAAATAQAAAAESRAEAAAIRLAQAQQKAASGSSSLTSQLGALSGGLGALGIGIGVQQLIQFGESAGGAALELDHTERVTKEIAGSTDVYNKIVAEARNQQRLFGGSLQENIDGLSGLAITSKNTGASLAQLIDLQKRLTVLNPAQGAQGGLIALNEALAGNVASLSRRFNIPRAELQKLGDTALPVTERLKVLDEFLNKVGVTSDAVSRSVSETAQTYNQLGASLDNAKTAAGGFLAGFLEPAARGLDRLTRLALGSRDAIIELRQVALGEDQATARINATANQIDALISKLAAARAQQAGGEAFSDPMTGMIVQTNEAVTASQSLIDTLTPLRDKMIAVAAASDTNAASVANAAQQLANGAITGPQFATILDAIAQRSAAGADIEDRRAAALTSAAGAEAAAEAAARTNALALADQAEQSLQATLRSQQLAQFQATLASLGGQVASGLLTAERAAAILEARYGKLSGEALTLINLQVQLARVTGVAASVGGSAANAAAAADAAALKARNDQILAVGTHTQKLQLLRAEYDRLAKAYGANSQQAIDAETKLLQEQDRTTRAAKAGGAARLSDQQKLNNSLLSDQEKFQDQMESAERQHQQRLEDIDREFQKRSLQQQRENDAAKIESRASFYKSLNVDNRALSQQVRDQLAAAYEAAFAKAQELAQSGNAQLADAYLKLKQQQLNAELQFQKDLAEAKKNGDAAQIKALQEARELEKQAEAEREKQLLEGGDANVKARQDALDEETRRNAEQQEKIGTASDNAAERKINNALRSGKAIDDENAKLKEQEDTLNRIGNRGGTSTSTSPGQPPATPGSAPTAGGSVDLGALASGLSAIQEAINAMSAAVTQAVESDTRQTVSAVRQIGGQRFAQ